MSFWLLWSNRTRALVVAGAVAVAILGGLGTAVVINRVPVGLNRTNPSPRPATSPRTQLAVTIPSPTASTSPLPTPSVSPTAQPLSCRLPVSGYSGGTGGFVVLPGGAYTPDPASAVRLPAAGSSPGSTYDRGQGKWLPVPRDWVAPDGHQYAFLEQLQYPGGGGGYLHIVDVASGGDRRVPYDHGASASRTNESWGLLGYEPEGVYLFSFHSGGYPSLWLVDSGGSFRQVGTAFNWQWVGSGGAWGIPAGNPQGAPLQRHDIASGANTTWIQRAGLTPTMLGLDGDGRAVILLGNDVVSELWLVDSRGGATKIHSAPGWTSAGGLRALGPAVSDSHGLWFGTSLGIFLYTRDGGVTKASDASGRIAGTCA